MQRSTIALAGGLGFRCFTCTSGSCMPPYHHFVYLS
jgi:hypothetical protein